MTMLDLGLIAGVFDGLMLFGMGLYLVFDHPGDY